MGVLFKLGDKIKDNWLKKESVHIKYQQKWKTIWN
jgi:hypothetical protein